MTGILYSFAFCTFQWKRMIDSAVLCIIHIDIAMAFCENSNNNSSEEKNDAKR